MASGSKVVHTVSEMKKKICIVTAARSEYGLLRWLIDDLSKADWVEFELVVTGGHLLEEQGHTIDQIKADGYEITDIVDAGLDTSSKAALASYMGRLAEGFASCFEKLKPDYLMVLGDRYELLPICNTAFVMRIPIIHISGGDVTEGAIDDGIRNAVTMLSTYHFPGTEASRQNIIRMRGSEENVWAVGEPGLDIFNRLPLMTRGELAENLKLDPTKKWALMTYHPETTILLTQNLDAAKSIVESLNELSDFQTVITYANADFGGEEINGLLKDFVKRHRDKFRILPSLGQIRYLSFMKQVSFVIGNSSSGIVEAPFLKIPVVNIGDRQKGRHICDNILETDASPDSISEAIEKAVSMKVPGLDAEYWGDGHASEKIVSILKKVLYEG